MVARSRFTSPTELTAARLFSGSFSCKARCFFTSASSSAWVSGDNACWRSNSSPSVRALSNTQAFIALSSWSRVMKSIWMGRTPKSKLRSAVAGMLCSPTGGEGEVRWPHPQGNSHFVAVQKKYERDSRQVRKGAKQVSLRRQPGEEQGACLIGGRRGERGNWRAGWVG